MSPDSHPSSGDSNGLPDPVVPAPLAARLRSLDGPMPVVPAGFDEDMLAMARARLRPRPVVRVLLRAGTGLAAAAALGLVAVLWWQSGGGGPGGGGVNIAALDPARQVDIVDAFVLARRLRDGARPDASWDVTRDGAVDEQDVEQLKAMAVRLDRASGGGA